MNKTIRPLLLSKRSFTLIEMMIVLVLLLGVGAAVAFNARAAIDQARFKADARGFKSVLNSIEELVATGFDPFLIFESREGGIHIVYQEAMGRFKKKTFDYPFIERILLNNNELTTPLFFASRGAQYPVGKLSLIGKNSSYEIDLQSPLIKMTANSNDYPEWVREVCAKKEKSKDKKSKASSS